MDIAGIAKKHRLTESDELLVIGDIVDQAIKDALPVDLREDIADLRTDLAMLSEQYVNRPRRAQRMRWCASGFVALVSSAVVLTAGWLPGAPLFAVCALVGLIVFQAVWMSVSKES